MENNTSTTSLARWLSTSKTLYLKDVEKGKGDEWTVVMGNESGGERSALAYPSSESMSQIMIRSRLCRLFDSICLDRESDQRKANNTINSDQKARFRTAP